MLIRDWLQMFLALAGINLIIDTLGNICNDLLLARERMVATSAVTVGHMLALITPSTRLTWMKLPN